MPLLNSDFTHMNKNLSKSLLDTLQDIAIKIEIRSDFSIHHPNYKPLTLPTEVVERFQKMPNSIQKKYLSLQLRSFLYGIYYNGSMESVLALDGKENNIHLDLENNTFYGIDLLFYQQLHDNNFGKGYFDFGWLVIKEEDDGSLAVKKGELKLHIQRNKHLHQEQKAATVGDLVAILLPKNCIQNGFYMALGNQGFIRLQDHQTQPITVRIYFNLNPEGAVEIMGKLTQALNAKNIPFSFKVLYNPKEYKRNDSGVLYFDKRDYELVEQVMQVVYRENKLHFRSKVPLFTMQLAPGLGLAEEPSEKFAQQESFGMNRCQIVANGLLQAWYQGDNSLDGRMQAIHEQFANLMIDLQHIYLNANSEDIYRVLDVSN